MGRQAIHPETGVDRFPRRVSRGGLPGGAGARLSRPFRPLASALAFALAGALVAGCAEGEQDPGDESFLALDTIQVDSVPPADTIAGTNWTSEDWRIFEEKVRWGVSERLDQLPMGAALVRLGVTFVGTTYTPGTLEAPGPEHLVINLRELDCVTFIENLLALTWLIRNDGAAILADRPRAIGRFEEYLTAVRYRDGVLDGYPSRLHYFSEWLTNNDAMGLIELRTRELGGVPDDEPIDFMTEHRESYRQLAEPENFEAVRRTEQVLNAQGPRYYVPQQGIAAVASNIRDGDLIAATSTVGGLDIAHTGIALWQDGRLHLMHAPLVGKNVEISELPLAERILDISGQDGIMVAAPLEWPAGAARGESPPSPDPDRR